MVFLEYKDLDFRFMLEKYTVLEKQFVCTCNALSGKMFKEQEFLKILGPDFQGLGMGSKIFDAVFERQEIKREGKVILTVFSNLPVPKKATQESCDNLDVFVKVMDLLNSNPFLRSVTGEFLQRKNLTENLPYFVMKEHKTFKIDLINKLAFSTIFSDSGEWDFDGKYAEFSFQKFKYAALDDYEDEHEEYNSNFDYCCYLLTEAITGEKAEYDPWRSNKKFLEKVITTREHKIAVNLFFRSNLTLLEKKILVVHEDDEEYTVPEFKEDDNRSKIVQKTKSINSTDNPKFRPDERAIFNYWNTKNLRKHKSAMTKGIKDFMSFYRKNPLGERELTVEMVMSAIDKFEKMVNDPEVQPVSPRSKAFLRGFGLNDFVFNPRQGRSVLFEILEKGLQTRENPHSSEMFDKVSHVVQRGLKGKTITTKNKNLLAVYTKKVASYLETNKQRVNPSVSYTKIATEAIRELFEKNRFGFLFIISEEFFANYFPEFCFNRGYMKKKAVHKVLTYKVPDKKY